MKIQFLFITMMLFVPNKNILFFLITSMMIMLSWALSDVLWSYFNVVAELYACVKPEQRLRKSTVNCTTPIMSPLITNPPSVLID